MATHKETNYLKGVFGENWREGMKKNPHIDRVDPLAITRARLAKVQRQKQKLADAARSAAEELCEKGKVTADQASQWIKQFES